jgi:alcohol dehydrogenase
MDELAAEVRTTSAACVVGIGGGTVLDIAKGMGILMTNPGQAIQYRGMDKVQKAGVPVVLLPTTAGTGSEVTKTASFIDLKENRKLGINGRFVGCEFSILDPVLTLSCPKGPTLSSGLDAMVHATEAIDCRKATHFSRTMGLDALELLFTNLPRVMASPADLDARSAMLLGSHYAGLAMWNAGGGPASGISYPLGAVFGVAHGYAGGIFLPHVIRDNVDRGFAGYASLADRLFPAESIGKSASEKSRLFADKFAQMYAQAGGPRSLGEFGLKKGDLATLTELTMTQRAENLELAPVTYGRVEVERVLEKVGPV